jgi:hypothetical protein
VSILPGIYASQITGHLITGSYDSIATVNVGAGGQSSISFTSIPSTYKHLQVRGIAKTTGATSTFAAIRLNGDTGANYSAHELTADGSTAGAYGAASQTSGWADPISGTDYANVFTAFTLDLLDYTNTNKYKTIRYLGGHSTNSTGSYLFLTSAAWQNTAAVTSLSLSFSDRNFAQYTSVGLYGIKG